MAMSREQQDSSTGSLTCMVTTESHSMRSFLFVKDGFRISRPTESVSAVRQTSKTLFWLMSGVRREVGVDIVPLSFVFVAIQRARVSLTLH